MPIPLHRVASLAALLPLLAACASYSPQRAGEQAHSLAAAPIGPAATADAAATDAQRRAVLLQPLERDNAVSLALSGNPDLQIAWSRLGIGAAQAFEASRLANPRLSASRLSGDEGAKRSLSLGLSLSDLLLLPQGSQLAARDFEALRIEVAARAVTVARDTESAWYRHVAAGQRAELRSAVADAAELSAELADRFHQAGTVSRLQLLRERAAASEARVAAVTARADAIAARQALNAQMGLSGELADLWQAPPRLAMPGNDAMELEQLLALADSERLDLRAARLQVGILEDGLAFSRGWRWLGGIELDYEWEREPDGSRMRGPGLSLELPLFHQGQARTMRADALLERGRAQLAQRELEVELGAREAAGRVQAMREVVALYQAGIVPDRSEAVQRELERYNFMLIGAFELLAARQAEYRAYEGFIDAVRDYWLAHTDLAHAIGTRLPDDPGEHGFTPDLQAVIAPPSEGGHGDHSMHGGDHEAGGHEGHEGHQHHGHHAPAETEDADDADHHEHDHHQGHDHGDTP